MKPESNNENKTTKQRKNKHIRNETRNRNDKKETSNETIKQKKTNDIEEKANTKEPKYQIKLNKGTTKQQ